MFVWTSISCLLGCYLPSGILGTACHTIGAPREEVTKSVEFETKIFHLGKTAPSFIIKEGNLPLDGTKDNHFNIKAIGIICHIERENSYQKMVILCLLQGNRISFKKIK